MKYAFYLLVFITGFTILSCSKSKSTPSDNGSEFKFVSLVPNDTVLPVNGITTIKATATGSGLTYHWTASYGTFVGNGSQVQWTVCHSDKFTVTCQVTDNNGHADAKEVKINVHN
ncbi:MAG: hypothetical protein NTX61_02450 [Bacteroidetes bacterium]|nr:hypothetical protein [Bacteroidota bacterium]